MCGHPAAQLRVRTDVRGRLPPMIFYLASQFNRREELCGYRADLEARGHSVPARWLLGEHQVHGVEAARLVQAGGPVPVEEARPFAEDDIEDIEACDVFVAFTAPPPQSGRGGRHFESGYAWSLHHDSGWEGGFDHGPRL